MTIQGARAAADPSGIRQCRPRTSMRMNLIVNEAALQNAPPLHFTFNPFGPWILLETY